MSWGAVSGVGWFLVGLLGALALVGAAVGSVVVGLGFVYQGLRLMRPRTWRRVEARLERAEVRYISADASGYHVAVHFAFTLERPGAAPEPCSGSLVDNNSYGTESRAQQRAAAYRAAGTLDVWYAEELPSLQYLSRPHWAWQAAKGLAAIAIGLFFAIFPVFIARPQWFGQA